MSKKGTVELYTCLFFLIGILSTFSNGAVYPGYTLVASSNKVTLYDMNKTSVRTWTAGGSIQTAAYLLADGSVLAPIRASGCFSGWGAHPHGRIQRIDKDNKVVWDYTYCTSTYTGAYDIQPMPNGNVLSCVHYSGSEKPGRIVEIQPSGTSGGSVIWECDVTSKISVTGYLNSVSYNPTLDQIAVTIQEAGRTCAVIDHKTGNVVSKYAASSGRVHGCCWSMDTYIGTNIKIPEADTAKMRTGNVTFVGNQLAQVIEISPKSATASLVKTLSYSFSSNQGGTQRLPNGNTLVTKASGGTIDELDETGAKIWTLTASGTALRCYKYGVNYPGVLALGLTGVSGKTPYEMNKALKVTYSRVSGFTTLSFTNKDSRATVRIFSLNGEEIFSQVTNESRVTLNTDQLSRGVYIAKVELASGNLIALFNPVR